MTIIAEARRAQILAMLDGDGVIAVNRLAETLGVSKETIRRDLSLLKRRGRLDKVHGGAVPLRTAFEASLDARTMQHKTSKEAVARTAAALFHPGDSLMIDAGSTTAIFAHFLQAVPDVHVITNSLQVATVLSGGRAAEVILLTGYFRTDRQETFGAPTIEQIRRYQVDHAVLTIGTLDETGAYDFDVEEAQVARAMIESARMVTIVADASKLRGRGFAQVCRVSQIDRLTIDWGPPPELRAVLEAQNVEIILPVGRHAAD